VNQCVHPLPHPARRSGSSSDREGSASKSRAAAPSLLTSALSPLTAGALAGSAADYVLAGGACLVARFGLCEVAGLGLHHLQPNVHYEPSTRTACVFRCVVLGLQAGFVPGFLSSRIPIGWQPAFAADARHPLQ
jgi:hypothetical protein